MTHVEDTGLQGYPGQDRSLTTVVYCSAAIHPRTSRGNDDNPKATGKPSDEADRHQIAMAKKGGAAYHASLKYMAEEVADSGGQKRAGDYIVAYAQERAEGMYMLKGEGRLEWDEPKEENCHLEISVSDAGDQCFIPYLEITANLTPENGEAVGPFTVP